MDGRAGIVVLAAVTTVVAHGGPDASCLQIADARVVIEDPHDSPDEAAESRELGLVRGHRACAVVRARERRRSAGVCTRLSRGGATTRRGSRSSSTRSPTARARTSRGLAVPSSQPGSNGQSAGPTHSRLPGGVHERTGVVLSAQRGRLPPRGADNSSVAAASSRGQRTPLGSPSTAGDCPWCGFPQARSSSEAAPY